MEFTVFAIVFSLFLKFVEHPLNLLQNQWVTISGFGLLYTIIYIIMRYVTTSTTGSFVSCTSPQFNLPFILFNLLLLMLQLHNQRNHIKKKKKIS
jgi:hypothetical protein